MLRSAVFALASLCSIAAAVADGVIDPTFNGTITKATCFIRTLEACDHQFCSRSFGPCEGATCGFITVSPQKRTYVNRALEEKPLDIVGQSPAELGKPLWIKFNYESPGHKGNGTVMLLPQKMGGYTTSMSILFPGSDPNVFSVETLDCDRSAGE